MSAFPLSILARLRKHHAVEHATAAVLFERHGRPAAVAGLSGLTGFSLIGPYGEDEVRAAAEEALTRLQSGRHGLAITDLCGTNVVAAGALAAAATLLASGRRWSGYPAAVSAASLAVLAAVPLGRWLQRVATTDPEVAGYAVARVQALPHPGRLQHIQVRLTRR